MAGTKSDLTNKKFSGGPGLRTFRVSDDSIPQEQYYPTQGSPVSPQDIQDVDSNTINAMNAHLAAKGFPPITHAQQQQNPQYERQTQSTEVLQDFENQVAESRRARTGKERLSDNAKKRIEMLCGIYRGTREVEIGGQLYALQTLKSTELKDAMLTASEFAGTLALPFETRKEFLARSLVQVGGSDIGLFLGDPSLEARLEFLDLLPEVLVERLFKEYDELDRETKIKFGVQSVAQAQEVAADLKK